MDYNYKSNSIKNRGKTETSEPVTKREEEVKPLNLKGAASRKKKNLLQKAASEFIKSDIKSIKNYALSEVVVPNLKRILSDTFNGTIDMLFYGEIRDRRRGRGPVAYDKAFVGGSSDSKKTGRGLSRSVYDYDDVILSEKEDCEDIIQELFEDLEEYGCVRVSDLYTLVGWDVVSTDHNYGWYDLRGSYAEPVRDGWRLRLPKVVNIKER